MARPHEVRPILIVDDDPYIRDVVQEILEEEGYPVATADDGAIALRFVTVSRPGLVLLDVDMPVVDGPTFARAYRAMEGPHAPIVVMTAAYNARSAADAMGADAHLGKPFQVSDLLRITAQLAGPVPDAGADPCEAASA